MSSDRADSPKIPPGRSAKVIEGCASERAQQVEFAHANVRLEGLEPSAAALALAKRYIAGEIDLDEFVQAVRRKR